MPCVRVKKTVLEKSKVFLLGSRASRLHNRSLDLGL